MRTWQPKSEMRFNSPARSMDFSQCEIGSAVSSPMLRTRESSCLEAARIFGASPKCSSSERARTGPTPSIKFRAMNASRESMRFDNGWQTRRQELFCAIFQAPNAGRAGKSGGQPPAVQTLRVGHTSANRAQRLDGGAFRAVLAWRKTGLIHQPIPVIALVWLVTKFLDEPVPVAPGHAEGGAGLRHDIFLNHDAAQIVRAKFQRDLPNLQALRDPRALDVFKIIEIDPAQCLGAQILMRANGGGFQLGVFGLKRPADERGEVGGERGCPSRSIRGGTKGIGNSGCALQVRSCCGCGQPRSVAIAQ